MTTKKRSRKPERRSRITRLYSDGRIASAPGQGRRRRLRGIALAPRERARGSAQVSNVLYFDRGSILPRRRDHGSLIAHATRLCNDRALRVTLVGHANRRESRPAKLIGLLRARNVGAVLVGLGARRSQVHMRSAGAKEPAGDAATRRGQALNRRVEVQWPDRTIGIERQPLGRRDQRGARRSSRGTRVPL